jgi:hypothetical protein
MNAKNQQKLERAQERIAREYRSIGQGSAAYYDEFTPNAWQEAHDTLEQVLLSDNEQLISDHISIFEGTLMQLIGDYRKIQQQQKQRERKMGLWD